MTTSDPSRRFQSKSKSREQSESIESRWSARWSKRKRRKKEAGFISPRRKEPRVGETKLPGKGAGTMKMMHGKGIAEVLRDTRAGCIL